MLGIDKCLPNPLGDKAAQGISISAALPSVAIRTAAAWPPCTYSVQDSSSASKGLETSFNYFQLSLAFR